MFRSLRTLTLVLCLVAPLALGGCFFHHRNGACGQPCRMKQEQCATCAQKCQMQCPNCPCKTAPAADAEAAK
jgi:hypothetical protein